MSVVTIPKTKYDALKKKARAYDILAKKAKNGTFFDIPATKNITAITKAFRASGRYNEKFIESVEKGLKQSIYFKE